VARLKYAFLGERKTTVRRFPRETVDGSCSRCEEVQREFGRRVKVLMETHITETAATAKNIEAHVTGSVEPQIKDIQERGRRMDMQMRLVSKDVASQSNILSSQSDILLNIRELLHDLLANNECKTPKGLARLRTLNDGRAKRRGRSQISD
jgi:hypothetical protein